MRRLLVTAVLVAAAAGSVPASAEPCVGTKVGVCYEGCPHTCRPHVIVDPRCIDWACDHIDPLYVDSDRILGPLG